ncbi:MAG: rod shape-determining protein MreD [Bacteroidetes bacterium]|nr:rod shape-determining protein MreD [Bacteroidota bacterium]
MTFKYTLNNLLVLIVVLLLQIFVFNNVNVYNLGFPMIYPLVILLIPVKQPAYWVMLAAFFTGLILDFFTNSGGLHAASLTAMAFARILVINKLEPQANYGKDDRPGIVKFGLQWTVIYFSILILVHHFFYFLVEESSVRHFGEVLLKTGISGILSFILMIALNAFIFRS